MLHPPQAPYSLADEELGPEDTLVHSPQPRTLKERLKGACNRWAMIWFGITFVVLSVTSFNRLKGPSTDPHFTYLANTYNAMIASNWSDEVKARRADKVAFELDRDPPHYNDWASYWELTLRDGEVVKGVWMDRQGTGKFKRLDKNLMIIDAAQIKERRQRYFISFPPGPALFMMPLAAILGYEVNDVLFTILIASINVMLLFMLLERMARGGRTGRSRTENHWLTLLFAFGTCHYWLSIMGQVWFTAQIMGVMWTLLFIHASIDAKHPLAAGLACAFAFSTRTPLLFTSIFFFLFVLFPGGQRLKREQLGWAFKKLVWFCTPCLIIGISLMVMNKLRFDSWGEFGHTYLAAGQLARVKTYGLFDQHFLAKNLTSILTLMPELKAQYPYVQISKHGMSMLITTPAFVYLLWPKPRQGRADVYWHRALWLTVAACAVPGLFYQNTGYEQFGFRFSVDYTPYLMLLLATGRQPITRAFKATILWSVAVNTFGAITFKRFYQFYTEKFFI